MLAATPTGPRVVLLGLDTTQGLQAARILAERGVPVVAIARDADHYACRTRVCERLIIGATSGPAALQLLATLGAELGSGTILIPCHDPAVTTLSRNRRILESCYRYALPGPDSVEMLMDKDRFYAFAAAQGLRVPAMHVLRNSADAEQAAGALQFPAILKPSRRSAIWDARTSSKAFRVDDATELLNLYARVREWAPLLLVQEWIEGSDADLYSCTCYFDQQGRPAATFIARKRRQWPPRAGSSCLREEVRNDYVLQASVRLLQAVSYRGLAHVEFKRDVRTGEHVMIETNVGRPAGLCAVVEAGGVEMLHALYCDLAGLALPARLEQHYTGAKCLDLRHDLQSAWWYWRRGELTLGDWWRSLRGVRAHAVWSWSDPGPMAWDLWRSVRMAFSRADRARRRHAFRGKVASLPDRDERRRPR